VCWKGAGAGAARRTAMPPQCAVPEALSVPCLVRPAARRAGPRCVGSHSTSKCCDDLETYFCRTTRPRLRNNHAPGVGGLRCAISAVEMFIALLLST